MELPTLKAEDSPSRHPHCCLSLSMKLLERLSFIFSKHAQQNSREQKVTVLSIGSGTGLLEALLQRHIDQAPETTHGASCLAIKGVEVEQSGENSRPVNRYLSEQRITTVPTTSTIVAMSRLRRDNDGDGDNIGGVMFVYPRQKKLVSAYADAIAREGGDDQVRVVVMLGPVSDWGEFKVCFEGLGAEGSKWDAWREDGGGAGLAEGEVMSVWVRRR